MRLSAATALLVGLSLAHIACAMDNEPDGFRGIKWGDKPGDGLFNIDSRFSKLGPEPIRRILGRASSLGWNDAGEVEMDFSKARELPEFEDQTVVAWMNSNLSFFIQPQEKNDFAGAQISTRTLTFYKNQFLETDLTFSTNSTLAKLSDYQNKEKVDAGLMKYFGLPDRQKLSFLDRLGYGAKKPTYQGEKMNIVWACRESQVPMTVCRLTFQCDEILEQLKNDLKIFQLQLAANRKNADFERRAKDQAAKPDY